MSFLPPPQLLASHRLDETVPPRSFRASRADLGTRSSVAGLAVALLCLLWPASAFAGDDFFAAVDKGPVYAIGVALIGGLLVSLTPCVYPMVAITVSVFGAKEAHGRLHGLALSSAFVLGIITMFTPLGVVAGMTGALFGAVLQSQWVLAGIAVLFAAMAASMFGAFEVALPSSLTNRLARVGGIGPRGAFALGLVCGLIAAPCTGPVLTGILAWIAKTQSAGAGAAVMASFALGLGFPFFLVGAFAIHLPKSGRWMIHVKSVLAIVLAVVALYYLETAFPVLGSWIRPNGWLYAGAGAAIVVGVALGAIHRDFHSKLLEDKLMKSVGAFLTTAGAFILVIAISTPARSLDWLHVPYDVARKTARAEDRPLLVDFTASWCGACKELDNHTFADPAVNREAGRFVAVKVDATAGDDPAVQQVMSELQVVGLPTVLIFDSAGKEVRRFTEFVAAKEFLRALRPVD